MIIDTSALLAILQDEPERPAFNRAIDSAVSRSVSTACLVEVSMVIESRYGREGIRCLDFYVAKAEIALIPVDEDQAHIACRAYSIYGKGRHRAGLNFGGCFSYALAKSRGEPLLFKGDDFSATDIDVYPTDQQTG